MYLCNVVLVLTGIFSFSVCVCLTRCVCCWAYAFRNNEIFFFSFSERWSSGCKQWWAVGAKIKSRKEIERKKERKKTQKQYWRRKTRSTSWERHRFFLSTNVQHHARQLCLLVNSFISLLKYVGGYIFFFSMERKITIMVTTGRVLTRSKAFTH